MAFPFFPGGMIVAIAVLGTALTLFGLGWVALERSVMEVRGSILPGMVRGVRAWIDEPGPGSGASAAASPIATRPEQAPGAAGLEELAEAPTVLVEHVRPGAR